MRVGYIAVFACGLELAAAQSGGKPELSLQKAMQTEMVDGDLKGAIEQYNRIVATYGKDRSMAARALLRLGECYDKLGRSEARKAYERLVREYPEQKEAAEARARLGLGGAAARTGRQSLRQICAGNDCDGWISPDGRYLSLTKDGNIFVRDLANSEIRQLTHLAAPARAGNPQWAPESKRLAYVTTEPGTTKLVNRQQTAIVNLDGTGARTVYRGGYPYGWSADGRKLLIGAAPDAPNMVRLWWVTVADGAVQALPTFRFGLDLAVVSPDGRYVAFGACPDKDSKENLYVMASDGSGETVVSANPAYQKPVGWTPDGKYLLYAQYSVQASLWAVPVNGGRPGAPVPMHLDFGSESLAYKGISLSGALYYRIVTNTSDTFTASMDPGTGKITSTPVPLPLSRNGHNQGGQWSPDGRRILHGWGQPVLGIDATELWVYSLDSGKEQRVATNVVVTRRGAYWSADGQSILFNTPRALATNTNQSEPIRFNLSTGEITTLFPGAANFTMDSASDGLVADWDPTGTAIKVRNLKTGSETEVHRYVQKQQRIFSPLLSHDGRWIAFRESREDGSTGIFVVSTEGGPARELARVNSSDQFSFPRGVTWSPDDRLVYFASRPDANAPFEVFRVPASGGAEESAGLKWPGIGNLDIAPDGRHIVFAAGGQQTEIWATENFLPLAK